MGASESTFSSAQTPDDKITTITERSEASDPILDRLKSLKLTPPILTSPPTEGTLTDILVRKPSSSSVSATVNPKVLLELFSMYRDWQEKKAQEISNKQVEIGELKGRLNEVISNCDALCKRIQAEGPESLRSSIKPFAIATAGEETSLGPSNLQTVSKTNPASTEE